MTSDEIEGRINNPAKHGITKIHVLRDKGNQLPVNQQVGATCGIYALDAALRIQGIEVAPRNELWKLIVHANARKGIVMPNACAADDGAPGVVSTCRWLRAPGPLTMVGLMQEHLEDLDG